jgi:hypothetical protein
MDFSEVIKKTKVERLPPGHRVTPSEFIEHVAQVKTGLPPLSFKIVEAWYGYLNDARTNRVAKATNFCSKMAQVAISNPQLVLPLIKTFARFCSSELKFKKKDMDSFLIDMSTLIDNMGLGSYKPDKLLQMFGLGTYEAVSFPLSPKSVLVVNMFRAMLIPDYDSFDNYLYRLPKVYKEIVPSVPKRVPERFTDAAQEMIDSTGSTYEKRAIVESLVLIPDKYRNLWALPTERIALTRSTSSKVEKEKVVRAGKMERRVRKQAIPMGFNDVTDSSQILADKFISPEFRLRLFQQLVQYVVHPESNPLTKYNRSVASEWPAIDAFALGSSLNGNNGEATNTDDLAGKGKAVNNKKKGTSKPKTSNIVYLKPTKQGKSKNRPQLRVSPLSGLDVLASKFSQELRQPFAPSSLGMKVPDQFSFPTTAYHMRSTQLLVTNTTGKACALFCPNPLISCIDLTASAVATTASIVSTGLSPVSCTPYSCVYGANTPATLSAALASYRVAGWGIKINNVQPQLVATGKLIVSIIPCTDTMPGYNTLGGTRFANQDLPAQLTCGVPASAMRSTAVLNLPCVIEVPVVDLLHGDLEVNGSYVSTDFWDFKFTNVAAQVGNGVVIGDTLSADNTTTYVTTSMDWKDCTRMIGGCVISVYVDGWTSTLPAGSSLMNIELVYHLEGTTQITTSSGVVPVPSTKMSSIVGSTNTVERAMSTVSGAKAFKWITRTAEFLNDNKSNLRTIGRAAKTVGMMALM